MKIKRIIKFLILGLSLSAFIIFTLIWWSRFNMPYNEAGRYFDGFVVWDEQGVIVYALLSILSFMATVTMGYIIWRKKSDNSVIRQATSPTISKYAFSSRSWERVNRHTTSYDK